MKSRKDLRGFTLVELIVVIVILAVLIGVTIGGVYKYVNKARVNTDINNAAALEKVLQPCTILQDKDGGVSNVATNVTWYWYWTDAVSSKYTDTYAFGYHVYWSVMTHLSSMLTDDFPTSKTGDGFLLIIRWDENGFATLEVEALCNPNCVYAIPDTSIGKLTSIKWNDVCSGGHGWKVGEPVKK